MNERKQKRFNKAKRAEKRYNKRRISLHNKCLIFHFNLIYGPDMRRFGRPIGLTDEQYESEFLLRETNNPMQVVAYGTLRDVESFIDRYWKLRAFL